uniref:Uncharacterized protein n=1 Tax=Spongospora subterranea TaxID=70186 RepID=A0A0H5RJM7_9EUKA|eukprot:CRZ08909.1 hypothetical protein [Spongospora subterranea]
MMLGYDKTMDPASAYLPFVPMLVQTNATGITTPCLQTLKIVIMTNNGKTLDDGKGDFIWHSGNARIETDRVIYDCIRVMPIILGPVMWAHRRARNEVKVMH